jgi:thiol-disulfide isomerase/thioredoxin
MQNEGKSREEIGTVLQKEIEKIYDLYKQAIEENKDNMIGAYILMNVAEQFYPTLDEFDNIVNRVKYAGQLHAIKQMREGLVKAEATSAGKMFVDFQGYAIDGKPSRLSDYVGKGKYVLVDFWASWCGPCKGEIPNLIELQNKFGGEKFMVLGVNVWDDEVAFKEALEEEGITYPQIVVPQNNKDNATELYGIKGIPQIILFAPDGTIVKRDLRGQAMKNLVEEKMK